MEHGAEVTAIALTRVPRMRVGAVISVLSPIIMQIQRERFFWAYVCDSLHYQPQNKYISKRYSEVVDPPKEDTRAPEEIAAEIIKKAGLTVLKDEPI